MVVYSRGKRKPKTKKLRTKVTIHNGEKRWRTINLLVHKPKKCSSPRRICIVCQVSAIWKTSKNYEKKICEACEKQQG